MKVRNNIIAVFLLLAVIISSLVACDTTGTGDGGNGDNGGQSGNANHVDYVAQTKLDMDSAETAKFEVSGLKYHIDGDTTHFSVPTSFDKTGVVKARYLAVNTPESTGQIEEWGKAASRFTEQKLLAAESIIIESDNASWNFDGNGRYLVWVWYRTGETEEYRNLNIELLQNGLGRGSSASEGRYGTAAVSAIAQANLEKLHIFSSDKDPEFPYDEAKEVTLKELRTNIESYTGANSKVVFEGIVTHNSDWTVFVESYDPETDMYYGIQVFYGYDTKLHSVLAQGNEVRITGAVNNFYGTYQVTDLKFKPMRPNDPANTKLLSSGNTPAYTETSAETFNSTGIEMDVSDDQKKTFDYRDLAMSTSISMKNLVVTDIWTTTKEESEDKGAMTLTCQVGDETISVRTAVLKDESGNLITEEYFEGTTISVSGIVQLYVDDSGNETYQIKVFSLNDIVKQ